MKSSSMNTHMGNIVVDNDVIAQYAGSVAIECIGIVGMAGISVKDGIAKILPASKLRRGITLNTTEEGVHVDLFIVVEYGTNMAAVSQNLIDAVSFVLKEQARVPVSGVEVHVQDVRVRK